MTFFGWRPTQSCYTGATGGGSGTGPSPDLAAEDGGTVTCPKATWFWLASAFAVVLGMTAKKKRK
jgi:hypothetical protein